MGHTLLSASFKYDIVSKKKDAMNQMAKQRNFCYVCWDFLNTFVSFFGVQLTPGDSLFVWSKAETVSFWRLMHFWTKIVFSYFY